MSKAQSPDIPPRPEEILDGDRIAYQEMADLSDEDYARLAKDIQERGVLNPILIDENDTILDGHHRAAIAEYYELDDSRAPSYLRLGDLENDNEKLARAIKQNTIGRDTTDGVKRKAVEGYIKSAWPRDDDDKILDKYETEEQVAEKLGVSQKTVNEAKRSLAKISKLAKIGHARHLVRQYYEENPDASRREIAKNIDADVGDSTVGNWIKEDFEDDEEDEDETESQPLNLFARNESEKEDTREITQKARSGNEEAEEQAEKVAARKSTPRGATKRIEKDEAEKEVEEQRETDTGTIPRLYQGDALEFTDRFDDGEIDLLLTDPPYTTDVDDIQAFAESWVPGALEKVDDNGRAFIFVGAYPDELEAYLSIVNGIERFNSQVMVWTYRNTLGASPKKRYKQNWQACIYLWTDEAPDLNAPKTSELWAVQDINAPDGRQGNRHHEWQKPDELVERLIRHATDEGDLVVDLFAGTGTTLLEASKLGREVKGCELDSDMIEIAVSRGCEEQ